MSPLRLPYLLLGLCAAIAIALAIALAVGLVGHARHTAAVRAPRGRACPGADPCPYTSVAILGHRGEGVLRYPEALAIAPDGDVYVADQYSSVVQRFSARGRFLGQWGAPGSGPGQFGAVGGLAVGPAGDVYLVDAQHDRVEEFDRAGRFVCMWGSPGPGLGQFEFGAGAPGVPPGGGIAVAGGFVYVADTGNDRIERFTLQGTHPFVLGGPGSGPGQLEGPHGLAVSGGQLYVADSGNNRIVVFDTGGAFAHEAGSLGTGEGQFASPFDVAIGSKGQVYVADDNNHRVVELTADLRYVAEWTLLPTQAPSEGEHPNWGSKEVSYPRAVAASRSGLLYVANAATGQVEVFGRGHRAAGRWGTSARSYGQFMLPRDVVATPEGGALVVDMVGGRIESFDRRLRYIASSYGGTAIIGEHLFKPVALARAPDGTLWVTDQENDLVRHLDREGELLGTVGGDAHTPAPARLSEPAGVAVARNGQLYVADTRQHLVKRFAPDGAPLGAFGDAGPAAARLHAPLAIAIGPAGRVFVTDAGDERVVEFTAAGRFVRVWGGPGSAPGRFRGPDGIAVDARGDVFVADAGNDRIEEFDSRGRLLRMWGAPGAAPGELNGPAGLSIGCGGALLVADTDNNRVQRFAGVAPAQGCSAHASP